MADPVAVNVDVFRSGCLARTPDGIRDWPVTVLLQDRASGEILAWACDVQPASPLVMRAWNQMLADHGAPRQCWADRGVRMRIARAAADAGAEVMTPQPGDRAHLQIEEAGLAVEMRALRDIEYGGTWTNPVPLDRYVAAVAAAVRHHNAGRAARAGTIRLVKQEG